METATATAVRRKVPRPRADALRNRERIVSAAREMFVEFGPEVPLDEVARRAACRQRHAVPQLPGPRRAGP